MGLLKEEWRENFLTLTFEEYLMSASVHVRLNKRATCAISLQIQQLRNLDALSRYKRNTFRNTECNFAWCHCAVMRDKAARDVHAPRAASVDGRRTCFRTSFFACRPVTT